MTRINSYHYTVDYVFNGVSLFVEGVLSNEKLNLAFSVGDRAQIKFNRNRTDGVITHFTKTKVTLFLDNGKTKSVPFTEFVESNVYTQTVLRIENEAGLGPYQSKDPSEHLKAWRKDKSAQYNDQLGTGHVIHPCPYGDRSLAPYAAYLTKYGFFAFDNQRQLESWFTKEDMALLEAEGFKVVFKQKGRDYYDRFHSFHQVAYVKTKEHYCLVEENRSRYSDY